MAHGEGVSPRRDEGQQSELLHEQLDRFTQHVSQDAERKGEAQALGDVWTRRRRHQRSLLGKFLAISRDRLQGSEREGNACRDRVRGLADLVSGSRTLLYEGRLGSRRGGRARAIRSAAI